MVSQDRRHIFMTPWLTQILQLLIYSWVGIVKTQSLATVLLKKALCLTYNWAACLRYRRQDSGQATKGKAAQ